jgi:hypothetical protein
MSSTPSNNPLRKWEKKLRNAKTEEQKAKAESMLRVLRPKVKTVKETKPVLTEDQLLQEAIEVAKKLIVENRGLEEKKRVQEKKKRVQEKKKSLERERLKKRVQDKVKSLERERLGAEILSGKVKKNKKKVAKVEDEKEQYENYKKEQSDHNQRVLSHMKHVEKFAEQGRVKEKLIVQHKNNKQKVDKEYKKFINKTCENIEITIQFVKGSNEMSYEEALTLVYSKTVKEEVSSNQGGSQLSLTDKVDEPVEEEPIQEEPIQEESIQEEPIQEEPIQEEPIQEEPIQEEPIQEELTEEAWLKIIEEHPELKESS